MVIDMKIGKDTQTIHLALQNKSVPEIRDIAKRVTEYAKNLESELKTETNLLKAAKKLEKSSQIRLVVKRRAFRRPPKYTYEHNGETKTWAGVGRVPLALQKMIDDGAELESFLIRQPESETYVYRSTDGTVSSWDGEGEIPNDLDLLVKQGYSLESFKK